MRFRVATIVMGIAAGLLWSLCIAAVWAPVDSKVLATARVMAGTLTILAVLCWMARALRDKAMLYCIDAAVASRRSAALATTLPLQVVRAR